jgi:hypothetical protein
MEDQHTKTIKRPEACFTKTLPPFASILRFLGSALIVEAMREHF